MGLKQFKLKSFIFVSLLFFFCNSHAQDKFNDSDLLVSLRMIGHQILLDANDSTSLVLPIIKEGDRYKIQFDTEFEFEPEALVATVDSIIKKTGTAISYIVEMENCETKEIVYSFKVDELDKLDIIPCIGRVQPRSCYSLFFTLIEAGRTNSAILSVPSVSTNRSTTESSGLILIMVALFLLISLVLFFLWRKKKRSTTHPHLIPLGAYQFDKQKSSLLIEQQRIGLTNKEADLLLLLYNDVNSTVEREVILKRVWGDEGAYVGRTLDVFISKLRKKLEFDSKVKIVNIRGVGYKLVLDV